MLSVSNIGIQVGARTLFDDVSFIVNRKDRIGLVGSNGSGKTTLLKIISGIIEPDAGTVSRSRHLTSDYLPQEGITFSGRSLYEEVYSGAHRIADVKREIDEVQDEMAKCEDRASEEFLGLVDELGELQHRFEELDGFKIQSKIEKILTGLGFKPDEFEKQTEEFSGGWQMRIALAKLLLNNASVLLLDEPTNHLDIESLIWLENFLKEYEGAVILVSHDRTFLDNLTHKTLEISSSKVTIFAGNYSFYLKEKESRRELNRKRLLNQQRYLRQQERFIERFRYKPTKASAVQSRIKMLEKMEIIEEESEESIIHFDFPPATHSGKITIELKGISKSYGSNSVLENVDLQIERGEKIGLVGKNGEGKSTLARILLGSEDIQSGNRKPGFKSEIQYYAQHQADSLDPSKTVLETLDETATGEIRKKLRTLLGCFLFRGDDVFKYVSVLSGGEKSRLALARMLLKPSNFLILDEPTNHLDMSSKRILMNALQEYDGTVMVISHDREFLDGIVNKIIEVRDKNIKIYPGNCSEYLQRKQEELPAYTAHDEKSKTKKKAKEMKKLEAEARNDYYRRMKPLTERLKEIERQIAVKEERVRTLENEMTAEFFYKDSTNVINVNKEMKMLREELEEFYEEWIANDNKMRSIENTRGTQTRISEGDSETLAGRKA